MLVAVVDTNVLVGGVLAGAGPSPNGRILDAMAAESLHFVLSDLLLAECRQVLLRHSVIRSTFCKPQGHIGASRVLWIGTPRRAGLYGRDREGPPGLHLGDASWTVQR